MEKELHSHFKFMRLLAISLLTAGILSLTIGSIGFLLFGTPFWKGLGMVFLLLSWIQLAKGGIYCITNSKQKKALQALLRDFPSQFVKVETVRLSYLVKQLNKGRTIELLLLILGITRALVAILYEVGPFTLGIGTGLSIQAFILFIYSLTSQWQADLFRHKVESFGKGTL